MLNTIPKWQVYSKIYHMSVNCQWVNGAQSPSAQLNNIKVCAERMKMERTSLAWEQRIWWWRPVSLEVWAISGRINYCNWGYSRYIIRGENKGEKTISPIQSNPRKIENTPKKPWLRSWFNPLSIIITIIITKRYPPRNNKTNGEF